MQRILEWFKKLKFSRNLDSIDKVPQGINAGTYSYFLTTLRLSL